MRHGKTGGTKSKMETRRQNLILEERKQKPKQNETHKLGTIYNKPKHKHDQEKTL